MLTSLDMQTQPPPPVNYVHAHFFAWALQLFLGYGGGGSGAAVTGRRSRCRGHGVKSSARSQTWDRGFSEGKGHVNTRETSVRASSRGIQSAHHRRRRRRQRRAGHPSGGRGVEFASENQVKTHQGEKEERIGFIYVLRIAN